jgi:hypothetical protein
MVVIFLYFLVIVAKSAAAAAIDLENLFSWRIIASVLVFSVYSEYGYDDDDDDDDAMAEVVAAVKYKCSI